MAASTTWFACPRTFAFDGIHLNRHFGNGIVWDWKVAALMASQDRAVDALDDAKRSSATPVEIGPVAADRFTRAMREQRVSGDVAARKTYLSSVVDAIVVSENKIRIIGSSDNIRPTFGPNRQPARAEGS